MTIEYKQLAQARQGDTSPVSVYSSNVGETVQAFIKIANTTASVALVRIFHDDDGTTYDETTAIAWDIEIEAGQILEVDKIFMDDADGNLAYRTSVASALTATVYGVVKS